MVSYSFSIPYGKSYRTIEGEVESPLDIKRDSFKKEKITFEGASIAKEVLEYSPKNTSFSIVYNK